MSKTLTVDNDVNTVDTKVLLTTQGSVTAPSLVTPSWARKIDKIIAAFSADNAASGEVVLFIRLGGNAVQKGEQTLVIGASGGQTPQAGSDQAPSQSVAYILEDVDIDVSPSDTIAIGAEMAGVDVGDTTIGVTLVFA